MSLSDHKRSVKKQESDGISRVVSSGAAFIADAAAASFRSLYRSAVFGLA